MRHLNDRAEVVATGKIGRVVECNEAANSYRVEFDGDESTRRWFPDADLAPARSFLTFLRGNSSKVFRGAASSIAFLLPVHLWYRGAERASRLQALILRPLIALTPYRRDRRRSMIVGWLLNSWLRQLSKIRRVIPMDIRTLGQQTMAEASRHPGGLVICSVHLPLVHAVLHSLVNIGLPPAGVVAGEPEMRDGRILVWGLEQNLAGILNDGNVLLKSRRILSRGGSVFALLDNDLGTPLSPNIFRLIRKVEARAVLAIVSLQPTGEILVEYFDPPDPFCRSDESIAANLEFLQARIDRLFQPSASAKIDSEAIAKQKDFLLRSPDWAEGIARGERRSGSRE